MHKSGEAVVILDTARRDIKVPHQAVGERIDPAMHRNLLPALPRRLHDDVAGDVPDLLDDIQLAKPVEPRVWIGDRIELVLVLAGSLADRVHPVIDQPMMLAVDAAWTPPQP